jgi:hypothetical protein
MPFSCWTWLQQLVPPACWPRLLAATAAAVAAGGWMPTLQRRCRLVAGWVVLAGAAWPGGELSAAGRALAVDGGGTSHASERCAEPELPSITPDPLWLLPDSSSFTASCFC